MLDILRKHASSWAIKIPIIAIIISFAFFFGYSALRQRTLEEAEVAATVNEEPVPATEYGYFLDSNMGRMQENFKDQEIPDFIVKMARQNTMQQMVTRALMNQKADEMGITIPDKELADIITRSQKMMQGGEFDPLFYTQRYLPHFKNRYGMDYEAFVRKDLKLDAYRRLYEGIDANPLFAIDDQNSSASTAWTFEIVEFEGDGKAEAIELIGTSPKQWKKKLKKSDGKKTNVGPIMLSEKNKLPAFAGELTHAKNIFALTEETAVIEEPIEHGGKVYVVRLVEKTEIPDDKITATTTGDFFRAWMSKLMADAKVQTFIEEPTPQK